MDNVLEQAAAVACSLARALEPSFGPLCRDQVLTGADGRTALTCHGAAILRALTAQLRGQHACARLIEAAAVHMDATHGDGATASVAMLAAALSAVSSLFPASPALNSAGSTSSAAASLPSVSVLHSNPTAFSSLDSTLSDRLAAVLDARRATARQRVLRLAAALRRLRADELPRMLMTTAHSVAPTTVAAAWAHAHALLDTSLAGKFSSGAVRFLCQLIVRWLRASIEQPLPALLTSQSSPSSSQAEASAAAARLAPVDRVWAALAAAACRFYAQHLPQTCVVLAGVPLRDSSLAEGAVLAREWLPAADQYVRIGAGAERQQHQSAGAVASTMVAQSVCVPTVAAATLDSTVRPESVPTVSASPAGLQPTSTPPALAALFTATAAHDQPQMQRRRIFGPSPSAALAHTQHSHVLILTRDISAPSHSTSCEAASVQVDSAAAFERALGHAHARAQRIARWWRHRLGVRLVVCASSALSDATLFACASHGIACAHGADRVELAVLQRTVGAHITAPENAVVAFLEDEEWARIIDERADSNAGVESMLKSTSPFAPGQATHDAPLLLPVFNQSAADALRQRLGVGSARLIEALSLGAGRPAIRIVGVDRTIPAPASGLASASASACASSRVRLHSLLLRAPHAVVGAQYQETVGRSLRLLADWFVNDAHEGKGDTGLRGDSSALRGGDERRAGGDASSRHAHLNASVAAAATSLPSSPTLSSPPASSLPSSLPSSLSPVLSPPAAPFVCAPMSSVGGAGAFELAMHAACDRRRRALSGVRRGGGSDRSVSAAADPSGSIDAWTLLAKMFLCVPRMLHANATSGLSIQKERDFLRLLTRLRDFQRLALDDGRNSVDRHPDHRVGSGNRPAPPLDLGLVCDDPLNVLRGVAAATGKGDFTTPALLPTPARAAESGSDDDDLAAPDIQDLVSSHSLLRVDRPLARGIAESLHAKAGAALCAVDTLLQLLRVDAVIRVSGSVRDATLPALVQRQSIGMQHFHSDCNHFVHRITMSSRNRVKSRRATDDSSSDEDDVDGSDEEFQRMDD